jgi:leader peptidase (prepilin peptidase)/N-methyltransferase
MPVTARVAATLSVAIGSFAAAVPWRLSEPWWVEAGLVAVLLVAGVAVAVDVISERIPDRVVLASLAPTAALLAVYISAGDARPAIAAVLSGAAAYAVPLLIAHLVAPAALGFGDVKLAGALGAAVGLVDWRYSIAALCLASGLTAVVALVSRRSTMPFAPGLVAGAALVLLFPILEGSPTWR